MALDNLTGKKISYKLSDYIRDATSFKERGQVAKHCNISHSSLHKVVYRQRTVTEETQKALIELMRFAIAKINKYETEFKKYK